MATDDGMNDQSKLMSDSPPKWYDGQESGNEPRQPMEDAPEPKSFPPPSSAKEPSEENIPLLSLWEILALNISFLGLNLMFLVLSVEIVPAQILALVGSKLKATVLGGLVAVGAVITLITGPTVGMMSDHLRTQFGRRRPIIFAASLLLTCGLLGMAFSAPHVGLQKPQAYVSNSNTTGEYYNGTYCEVDLEWRRCEPYFPNSSAARDDLYRRYKNPITLALAEDANIRPPNGFLGLFIFFYCLVICGYVATLTPYHALVADRSHPDQRGICSGVLGGMVLLGNICGAALGLLVAPIGVVSVYVIAMASMLLCIAITLCCIRELPISDSVRKPLSCYHALRGFWIPLRDHNFRWVFITRFLMQMGLTSTVGFMQFWIHDMIPLPYCWSAIRGVSFLLLPLLVFAAAASIMCGILSDRLHLRKTLVMCASFTMCITNLALAALHGPYSYYIALGVAVVFGIAFGGYQAVDFALLMDVLPDPAEKSRDIAVWNQALNLPQALAVPIAGIIVDVFERVNCHIGLGYIIMFSVGAVYFFLSGIFVLKIHRPG